MNNTREKLRAVFLTALMIGSVFAAGVAFTGGAAAVTGASNGANASGDVQEAAISSATVTEGHSPTLTFSATFQEQAGSGDTDTAYLVFPDQFAGELSPNGEFAEYASDSNEILDTSSISIVDGPDQDGNQDTLRAQYDPTSDGDVEVQFDTDITTLPDVAVEETFDIEFRYDDSDDTSASTNIGLTVQDSDGADGLTVDPDETVDNGDTTFSTLAYAYANSTAGDTITVQDGSYEPITVGNTLTIQAAEGANPTISADSGVAVDVTEADTKIDGFTINGADGQNVIETSATGVNISNNVINPSTGSVDYVFAIAARSDVTVTSNTISEGSGSEAFGIRTFGSADGSTITDNTFEYLRTGIQTENDRDIQIDGNTFSNIDTSAVYPLVNGDSADLANDGDGYQVTNNDFSNVGNGVDVQAIGGGTFGGDLKVTGNNFESASGLEVSGGTLGAVEVRETDGAITSTVNATNNWWGDASGPSGIGYGSGDALNNVGSAEVTFTPWLDSADGETTPSITVEPDQVMADGSVIVDVTVEDHPSDATATGDVGYNGLGTSVTDGATVSQSGSFSFVADPVDDGSANVGDTYDIRVNYDSGNDGTITLEEAVTVTEEYNADLNFDTDPAEPVFNEDVISVTGDINVTQGGSAYDGSEFDLELRYENGTTLAKPLVTGYGTSTTGTVNFAKQVNTGNQDAGEFQFVIPESANFVSEDTVIDSFSVDSQQGDLTVEADPAPVADDPDGSTYTLFVNNSAGTPQDLSTDGDGYTNTAGDTIGVDSLNGESVQSYVNVTGPFASDSVSQAGDILRVGPTNDDGDVEYIHVTTDSDVGGSSAAQFDAIATGNDVTTSLEVAVLDSDSATAAVNEVVATGGIEAVSPYASNQTVDIVADDVQIDVAVGDQLNVGTQDITLDTTETTVEVTGENFNPVASENGALDEAEVTLSSDQIDGFTEQTIELPAEADKSGHATFSGLTVQEGGNITVDVTARSLDADGNVENEYTVTKTIEVDGDQVSDLAPTNVNINDTEDVSLQVTDVDGTPLNNRIVELVHQGSSDGFNVTDANGDYQTTDTLIISGPDGAVYYDSIDSANVVEDFGSVNNGQYSTSAVTFAETGDVSLQVFQSDHTTSRANFAQAIDVTGIEAYDVNVDVPNNQFLTGNEEQVNVTVTENGERVNGSALNEISLADADFSQAGESIVTESFAPVDTTDEYDGVDVLQGTVNADNSETAAVNVTVSSGSGAFSGSANFSVVEPDVLTTHEGDLTFGIESEMNVTVEDPRDGSGIAGATVDIDAINATFQYDNRSAGDDTLGDVADATSVTVNENGTREIAVAPEAGTAEAAPQTLNLSATIDSGPFGETAVNTGNITLEDTPANLDPGTEHSLVLNAVDANGNQLDLLGVKVTGSGLEGSDKSKITDEGFVNFDITTSDSGIITYNASDAVEGSEIDLVSANDYPITVAQTNVYEQVNLSLSADTTDIQQGDSVNFTLTREDFDQQTTGNLTITNASGDVVETVHIQQTASVTFDEPGNYSVTAEKPTRPQVGKAFLNDSVDVAVEEVAEPEGVQIENVSLDPSSVEPNTTNNHTLTFDAVNVSDDGNTDTFEVAFPTSASVDNINNVSVVDADGETVSITGSPELVNNGVVASFDVSPDSDAEYRDLTVTVDATVSAPDVENVTTADVTASITDSSNGEDSASTTLSITNATSIPAIGGSSSPPTDTDGDGKFEDVDGDGNVTFNDAVALSFGTDTASEYPDAFDFDGDGDVDFDDAVELSFNV